MNAERLLHAVIEERDRTFALMNKRAVAAESALHFFLARDPEKPTSWLYTRNEAEALVKANGGDFATLVPRHDLDSTRADGRGVKWQCPINHADCKQNCGSYGCGN